MNAKPRTILILVGIFLAGAASGMLLPWRVFPPPGSKHQGPRPKMVRILERIKEELELTPEQRPQVEAIIRESSEKLEGLRRESFKVGAAEIEAMNARIQALLTPAQREKFAELQREQRERMRRFEREPFGPRHDHAPREGAPPLLPPGERPADMPPAPNE
ncbi:MAG TPA: hypothetical protein VK178_00315 [Opitutaceae bacterium]|nr:hypothetical protein [Opitutaceae bacterium]